MVVIQDSKWKLHHVTSFFVDGIYLVLTGVPKCGRPRQLQIMYSESLEDKLIRHLETPLLTGNPDNKSLLLIRHTLGRGWRSCEVRKHELPIMTTLVGEALNRPYTLMSDANMTSTRENAKILKLEQSTGITNENY